MEIKALSFSEMSVSQWQQIIKLRAEVFVLEQQCVYVDPDDEDSEAEHIIAFQENKIVGYARLMKLAKGRFQLGRVIVAQGHRGKGVSTSIIEDILNKSVEEKSAIQISAQAYLEGFYTQLGFRVKGNLYLEDGIPHIKMTFPQ